MYSTIMSRSRTFYSRSCLHLHRRRRIPFVAAAVAAVVLAECHHGTQAFSPCATFTPSSSMMASACCSIDSSSRRSPKRHVSAFAHEQQDVSERRTPSSQPCVVERLDLGEQFNRWKLLQQLLEAEADAGDINEVLFRVMKSFLDVPRPLKIKDTNGITRSNTSPLINDEKKMIIQSLLDFSSEEGGGSEIDSGIRSVPAFTDGTDCIADSNQVMEIVEKLLPDPVEDEDAHKTCWDVVMEMYGKEAVKSEEMEGSKEWRARCAVARVLIHYDFLEAGIVEDARVFLGTE